MADTPADRLREATELHQVGLDVQREKLRRRHPGASEADLDALIDGWLAGRPMDHTAT